MPDALVVFNDSPVRHLTHCSVCVASNGFWLRIDGHRGRITLETVECDTFDLAGFWRGQGLIVVKCTVNEHADGLSPFILPTCIELVKRTLGIRAPWVLTSRQLYHYLEKKHENI